MRKLFLFLLPILLFPLSACSDTAFKVINIPAGMSDVTITKDVSYGSENLQNLDIYMPPKANTEKYPVLIFIHGGRWTEGNKNLYAFIGNNFAKEGYVTVVINHRKYPQVKFPTFVEDGAQAISWTYNNIAKYKGDKNNIFLAGHSSGAHIGALAISDKEYLKKYDLKPDIIKGFAGLAGPYAFTPEAPDLIDMFGPADNYPSMQVTSFIDGSEPPMLLLYGLEDDKVDAYNHERLAQKINEKKGRVEIITYENVDHTDIMANMTWFWPTEKYVLNDMVEFFTKNTKTKK